MPRSRPAMPKYALGCRGRNPLRARSPCLRGEKCWLETSHCLALPHLVSNFHAISACALRFFSAAAYGTKGAANGKKFVCLPIFSLCFFIYNASLA
ncbi:hypothetical protein HMPREF1868_00160 [Olsenella sp. DNF00959]|nr:hypothetical protein HMPREF1868_00160 [Olsenella sp. DNF00959]